MMDKQQILANGQQQLATIRSASEAVNVWKRYLMEYRPLADYCDDAYVWLTCGLALRSVAGGNFGVGSILVNDDGHVVVQGHNQVFHPHFRSDRHAEMVVMDDFEDAHHEAANLEGYTLYTSLEPCPMCLVRLSTTRVGRVAYGAADVEGGMVSRLNELPPFWVELARSKSLVQAQCTPQLLDAALQIFLLNLDELMAKIR